MSASEFSRPRQNATVRCRYLPEWSVAMAYSPELRNTVILNNTSYLLWRLCDGSRTVEEIEALFQARFTSPLRNSKRISREIYAGLQQLQDAYLLCEQKSG